MLVARFQAGTPIGLYLFALEHLQEAFPYAQGLLRGQRGRPRSKRSDPLQFAVECTFGEAEIKGCHFRLGLEEEIDKSHAHRRRSRKWESRILNSIPWRNAAIRI